MSSTWSEISLGSDDEQKLSGRVRNHGSSRSTSESESIKIENDVDLARKQLAESQAKSNEKDQTSKTKRPDNSYAYQLGMMLVRGAAKVANNVADGGRKNRDAIKQLRVELDDSRLQCDKLELDVENARQWVAYYENINGGLQNRIEENEQKYSLEQQSLREKLLKSEQDAESCRKALAEVTKMKDAMEGDVKEAKSAVTIMKKQVENAQKKIAEFQKVPVPFSLPNVAVPSTSTQADFTPLEASSLPPEEQLLIKLKNKEIQLKDAASLLQVSLSQGDTLRRQLMTSLKSMRSQTRQMRRSKTTLNSAVKELSSLKTTVEEEKQNREKMEVQVLEQLKTLSNINENLEGTKALLMQTRSDFKEEQTSTEKKLKAIQKSANDLKLNNVAKNLVSFIIQDVVQNQQQEVCGKQFKSLMQTVNTLSQRLHSAENSESSLRSEMIFLQSRLCEKDTAIEQCHDAIKNLQCEMKQLKTENEQVHKKENEFKDQTTSTDQEIENTQDNSSQQLYIAKLENEVKELKDKNFWLDHSLQENEVELYAKNRSMWQVHDKCRRLNWHCRNQYWQIQDLKRENMELRRCIEKQPAHFGTSSNCAYYEPSTGNTGAQYYQPTYYPTDQNQTFSLDESTNGKPSQTKLENEERSSTSPSKHSIPQKKPCTSKQMPENDGAWYSTGDAPVNFYDSNKKLQEQVSQKIFRKTSDDEKSRCCHELDTTDVAPDDTSALAFDALFFPSKSHQRPVGIPMPEHCYNKISAEMLVPNGKVVFFQNNLDNSPSSSYSNVDIFRSRQFPAAESVDSAILEQLPVNLTDEKAVGETERHYYVTYNEVQFDMANLSIPQIRYIASASGAVASQQGMNDFYYFLAKRIEEMDKNPRWKGAHNLGSPSAWLSLQKNEE